MGGVRPGFRQTTRKDSAASGRAPGNVGRSTEVAESEYEKIERHGWVGGRAFQRPMADGFKLLNTIQDVYADKTITVA